MRETRVGVGANILLQLTGKETGFWEQSPALTARPIGGNITSESIVGAKPGPTQLCR
jgi:hypothetical protein